MFPPPKRAKSIGRVKIACPSPPTPLHLLGPMLLLPLPPWQMATLPYLSRLRTCVKNWPGNVSRWEPWNRS
ncbi:hypothetical protein LIER_36383 [Lithospermum erythrorhizon]|uniref:Uncharacterized protein n=1 Tax=Lithospermum erythrorhizon TaxID=34254 RepID=A0AAV3P6Q5_LITER